MHPIRQSVNGIIRVYIYTRGGKRINPRPCSKTMDSTSKTIAWATVWTKCCLCQQDKDEELKSPHANPSKGVEFMLNQVRLLCESHVMTLVI